MSIIKATKRINPHTNDEEIQCYNNLMPINCTYTQYPFIDIDGTYIGFRDEDKPQILFGGVWEERYSSKSVFFRTKGGESEDFTKPKGTSSTPAGRINGIQSDAMPNITGTWTASQMTGYSGSNVSASGALYHQTGYSYNGSNGTSDYSAIIGLNVALVVPTASENRPINMLMIIWQRVS